MDTLVYTILYPLEKTIKVLKLNIIAAVLLKTLQRCFIPYSVLLRELLDLKMTEMKSSYLLVKIRGYD